MKRSVCSLAAAALGLVATCFGQELPRAALRLPEPPAQGKLSVEEAIGRRRTAREFSAQPLTLSEVSALLWSGQGITDKKENKRAAPSAGALYPLELLVAVKSNGVKGLAAGLYQYQPPGHRLLPLSDQDLSKQIAAAALNQNWVAAAPVIVLVTGDYSRTAKKYGERARRYVHLEAGHAAENILLEAQSLGLAAGIVGAFDDAELGRNVLRLPASLSPLLLLPLGHPAAKDN
jgi:SagB-type dehydrogenase family enzyme